MTFATKITILRILLIPVFVAFAAYYGSSVAGGAPDESLRLAAIATFVAAALSDALDGFIARRFHQESRLGRILDPIADKGLMLAAIFVLTLGGWSVGLPIWFAVLVITKEVVTVGGAFVIHHVTGTFRLVPHWIGKTSTLLQMVTVTWVMLASLFPPALHPAAVASFLILASGIATVAAFLTYIVDGIRQLSHHTENAA